MKIYENVEVYASSVYAIVNAANKIIETYPKEKLDYSDIEIDTTYDSFGVDIYKLSYCREETKEESLERDIAERIKFEKEKTNRFEQYLKLKQEFETQE